MTAPTENTLGERTARQQRALAALLETGRPDDAASSAGVSARTLRRWRTMPEWVGAMREARRRLIRETTAILAGESVGALNTLREIHADPAAPAHARTSAAVAVLRSALESHRDDELAERLDRIENVLAAADDPEPETDG